METVNSEQILNKIKTDKVDLTEEEYSKVIEPAYLNAGKKRGKRPSEELRHKRIASNFMGTVVNMLLPVYQMTAEQTQLLYAIADKVGVEFEKIETEEEKTMRQAGEYLKAGTEKRNRGE